jgi:hypothetical protein
MTIFEFIGWIVFTSLLLCFFFRVLDHIADSDIWVNKKDRDE